MHLFAYGTLMFPEIWQRVVGREFRRQPATLAGYTAYRVVGDSFPVLVPGKTNEATAGVAVFDLDDAAIQLLDEHESTLYDRVTATATLDDGHRVDCQAYMLPQRNRRYAATERWTAEWFQREAMAEYIARHWPGSGDF
jgi:gamma-glutamylcyclotransferase (GGCT)/AIG2-like uncharacterized protein YtfP